MGYYPPLGQVVLFGGQIAGAAFTDDTWVYNGTARTWSPLAVTGPSRRCWSSMAFDPIQQRLVLFGGSPSGSASLGDTWVFDGQVWTDVTPASGNPPARSSHSMVWDSSRQRILLLGGVNSTGILSDLWEWDGSAWMERVAAGGPARSNSAAAYDTARGRLVTYGGFQNSQSTSGTYELGTSWTSISTRNSPGIRRGHAMVFHPAANLVLLVAGYGDGTTEYLTDAWTYDAADWTSIASPGARYQAQAVYDSGRGKAVLFGGQTGTGVFLADTWEF